MHHVVGARALVPSTAPPARNARQLREMCVHFTWSLPLSFSCLWAVVQPCTGPRVWAVSTRHGVRDGATNAPVRVNARPAVSVTVSSCSVECIHCDGYIRPRMLARRGD